MAVSVHMPALGESVTEGTVTRWLKQEGDAIEVDEPLLEVSTDKVDTEIPAPATGILTKILAPEDTTIEVGGELAIIGDSADPAANTNTGAHTAPPQQPASSPSPAAVSESQQPSPQSSTPPAAPSANPTGPVTSVVMPELGESVTEGTVTRWLKAVGDSVALDEALVEVSTDKVDTEIPAPAAGTLLSITAETDVTVPVGSELAQIGPANAATQAASPPAPTRQPDPTPAPTAAPTTATPPPPAPAPAIASTSSINGGPGSAGSAYVTPLVRKLAAENGINLATVQGSGVGGRIRKHDVLAAAKTQTTGSSAPAAPAASSPSPTRQSAAPAPSAPLSHLRGSTQKANRIRQLTAKKTRESLQATAQLTQTHEVDMTTVVALRSKAKTEFAEREGVNLTFLPFIARAVIDALKAHPNINASYNEDTKEITYYDAEHLGFAVDTDQGLLSPVIHNAGDLSLAGLARAINDIASRARSGDLKPDELSGGTFTITNIGSQGALFDTPILVPPQAAMLGTGAIVKRPRVIVNAQGQESIGVRSICYLPLTYDHRLIDGADAGRFLTTIKRRLEEGAFEADLGL